MKKIGAEIMVLCSLLIAVSACDGANAETRNVVNAGVVKDINVVSTATGSVVLLYPDITSEIGILNTTVTFTNTNGKQVVLVNVPVSITER